MLSKEVQLPNGLRGQVVATSGLDRLCLVRMEDGQLTNWIAMDGLIVLTAPEPDVAA